MRKFWETLRRYVTERRLTVIGTLLLAGTSLASITAVWIARHGVAAFVWLIVAAICAVLAIITFYAAPRIEANHLVAQARGLVACGSYESALTSLNRALELYPQMVEAYLARSAAYAGLSQLDLAMQDADRAVRIAPLQPETRLTRARLYSHRGLHEFAIRDVEIGLHERPNWDDGYLELARLHLDLEDYEASLAALRALDTRTASDRTRYEALILAGQVYEKNLNDLDKAIATYSRAIPILPDCKIGYMHRAHTYMARGDAHQAAEDLLRAAQRPSTPEDLDQYHWLRAVCYNRRWMITGEDRDLEACINALQRSLTEDAPIYRENARQWLQALDEQQRQTGRVRIQRPVPPRIYPN
ncbi:MAG TPA: tetratricopeptide repeat protein [Aggregatilineales bacterium]|nr:tetratricopeptide repeat protein [Aggregatilineales bacterium]